jgi:hydroxymethylglutaryl-CoA reductase (NADPH)
MPEEDEEIVAAVVAGKISSYMLETRLGDCRRATGIRREALRRITGRKMDGLPLDGFDYASILGQCCELPMGFVQLLVGVAGPLLLDREPFREVGNTFLLSGGSEGIVADGADPAAPASSFIK